jgi:hypothetical protein
MRLSFAFAFAIVIAVVGLVWTLAGSSDAEKRLAENAFRGVPSTVLEVRQVVPLLGSVSQPCEWVLVDLLPDAPDHPPDLAGAWKPGPAKWYQPDSYLDNDDLMLCGLNRFSGELKETLAKLANSASTWWLDNGRGGYLYSKDQGLAFYFYLID